MLIKFDDFWRNFFKNEGSGEGDGLVFPIKCCHMTHVFANLCIKWKQAFCQRIREKKANEFVIKFVKKWKLFLDSFHTIFWHLLVLSGGVEEEEREEKRREGGMGEKRIKSSF